MKVNVVFAEAHAQTVIEVECNPGTTIAQAILLSGIESRCPGIELDSMEVGVFGYKHSLDYELEPDDRVEIYRPLTVTPVEARRLRAKAR